MEIFGVGPMEIIYILLILLLVFGPNDIARSARSLGSFINRWRRSDEFHMVKQVTREMRDLPNHLVEEAGLEEVSHNNLEPLKETVASIREEIYQQEPPKLKAIPQPQEEVSKS